MKKPAVRYKKGEVKQLQQQLVRALADYDNLQKRVEREETERKERAALRLILKLLPILDNLRQAQNHLADSGVAIIIAELENILKDEGLEEIKIQPGEVFDPNRHEAVEVIAKPGEKHKIEEIVLSGWKFKDGPIIRHARVKVGG